MPSKQSTHDPVWGEMMYHPAEAVANNWVKMGTNVGSDAVEVGTTATVLNVTGHAALAGDQIIMTSGGEDGEAREVASITANTITLSTALSGAPSSTETFRIIRPIRQDEHTGARWAHLHNGTNQTVDISFDGITRHMTLLSLEEWFPPGADYNLNAIPRGRDYDNTTNKGYVYIRTFEGTGTPPTTGATIVSHSS